MSKPRTGLTAVTAHFPSALVDWLDEQAQASSASRSHTIIRLLQEARGRVAIDNDRENRLAELIYSCAMESIKGRMTAELALDDALKQRGKTDGADRYSDIIAEQARDWIGGPPPLK